MPVHGGFTRRHLLAGAAVLLALAAAAVAIADPFAGGAAPGRAGFDNGSPTALRRVERASLASQRTRDTCLTRGTLQPSRPWSLRSRSRTSEPAYRLSLIGETGMQCIEKSAEAEESSSSSSGAHFHVVPR